MDVRDLENYWALLAGSSLAILVLAFVVLKLFRQSAAGQLRRVRGVLKAAVRERDKAVAQSTKALRKVQKLDAKSASTKPRLLTEAKEFLDDSRALEKIAQDKLLVAENHVRQVICEEYPPHRHDKMRAKYLPSETSPDKPFTF